MIDEREVFASIPPLRESTEEMIRDSFPVILWYRSKGTGKEYWCSRCGAHETVKKVQRLITDDEMKLLYSGHKDKTRCPSCCRLGEMACIGRVRNASRYAKWHWFLIVQPVSENEVWMRETEAWYKPYIWNDSKRGYDTVCTAQVGFKDYVRYRLTPGEAKQWTYRWEWGEESEIRDVTKASYPWHTQGFRPGTSSQMLVEGDLSETFLRYNSYEKTRYFYGNIGGYLANYAMYPSIEMMVKAGFHGFVSDLVVDRKKNKAVVDWTQTDPRKAFHIPKEIVEKLRRAPCQQKMLQDYHRYRKRGEKDPWYCAELIWKYRPSWGVKQIRDDLKASGTTEIELYKYFEKILEENPGCHMARPPAVDRTWKDYIEAAKVCGYDLSQKAVVMPKDLYGKHNDAVALRNELRPTWVGGKQTAPEIRKKFEERLPALTRKYAKMGEKYFIRIPAAPEEIVTEGQTLHHCVGGYSYISNHAAGRNPILFLRRVDAPDEPWYTMEINVDTNKILQCEGCPSADGHGRYGHIHREDLPDDAKAFLDEWESERTEVKKKKESKSA